MTTQQNQQNQQNQQKQQKQETQEIQGTQGTQEIQETQQIRTHSKWLEWPEDSAWPEPFRQEDLPPVLTLEEIETAFPLDEEANSLLEIKEYFDGLLSEGVLVGGYKTYEDEYQIIGFYPEKGEEYWVENDDGTGYFDLASWQEDISERINLLKLELPSVKTSVIPVKTPVPIVEAVIGYQFINENLLRQAFTRRSFALEYKVGDGEQLEFIGDSVLNTVVTREIVKHSTETNTDMPVAPFTTLTTLTTTTHVSSKSKDEKDDKNGRDSNDEKPLTEGDFTKIRNKFVNKDYLASRAVDLGLDKFILYGSCEEPSASAREDVLEAIIGAVAIDSDWDWEVLERVIDHLVNVQVSNPNDILKATYYEVFNSWHQRHFASIPDYKVFQLTDFPQDGFMCRIVFHVPEEVKEPEEVKGLKEYRR